MTKPGWTCAVRWSALPAVVVAFTLVACAPEDYAGDAEQGTAAHQVDGPEPAFVGGADPTAMSGRIRADSESTIHHPGADGNAGRAPDPPGTVTEATPRRTGTEAPVPHLQGGTEPPTTQAPAGTSPTP